MERQTWRCLSVCLWELQMTHCHSFLLRTCREDDAGVPLHLHAITQQIAFSLEAGKWNCLFSLLLHMWEGSRPCRDRLNCTSSPRRDTTLTMLSVMEEETPGCCYCHTSVDVCCSLLPETFLKNEVTQGGDQTLHCLCHETVCLNLQRIQYKYPESKQASPSISTCRI